MKRTLTVLFAILALPTSVELTAGAPPTPPGIAAAGGGVHPSPDRPKSLRPIPGGTAGSESIPNGKTP